MNYAIIAVVDFAKKHTENKHYILYYISRGAGGVSFWVATPTIHAQKLNRYTPMMQEHREINTTKPVKKGVHIITCI